VDWMHVAQDRDQCRAVVNTVMNLRVPWMAGNILATDWLLTSQEGLCSVQLFTNPWVVLSSPLWTTNCFAVVLPTVPCDPIVFCPCSVLIPG
jgi:hypothetical protein